MIRVNKLYTPIGDQVALQPIPQKETPGGIVLTDQSEGAYETTRAWVIAAGPDCKQVREGNLVLIPKQLMALKMRYEGQETLLVHEKDLGAVVDGVFASSNVADDET